jgi:hypothetical protein
VNKAACSLYSKVHNNSAHPVVNKTWCAAFWHHCTSMLLMQRSASNSTHNFTTMCSRVYYVSFSLLLGQTHARCTHNTIK